MFILCNVYVAERLVLYTTTRIESSKGVESLFEQPGGIAKASLCTVATAIQFWVHVSTTGMTRCRAIERWRGKRRNIP